MRFSSGEASPVQPHPRRGWGLARSLRVGPGGAAEAGLAGYGASLCCYTLLRNTAGSLGLTRHPLPGAALRLAAVAALVGAAAGRS